VGGGVVGAREIVLVIKKIGPRCTQAIFCVEDDAETAREVEVAFAAGGGRSVTAAVSSGGAVLVDTQRGLPLLRIRVG
jgi:hypothetical protein